MEVSRKTIKRGIIISVSISILALVLVMLMTDSELTFSAFSRIDINYLVMAAAVTITFWLLKSLKLQVLTRALGRSIPFHKVFSIYLASAFVAHVTPYSFGGLPFQIYFLHKEGLPLGQTTALTVLDGMLNVIIFMAATPFLLFAWGGYLNLGPRITNFFYLAVVVIVLFIIGSMILIFNAHLAKGFIGWLIGLSLVRHFFSDDSLAGFQDFIEKEIDYFNDGIRMLARSRRDMLLVLLYTIFYWSAYLSLAPILLMGMGIHILIPPVILAQLVFNFIQPLIPTPGGSGGAELGFAYLFRFMVPDYLLGVFVTVWRFFIFYFSLIFGGIFFVHLVQGTDYLDNQ